MTSGASFWVSDTNMTTFANTWTIQNVSYCKSLIESRTFNPPGNNKLQWYYRFCPEKINQFSGVSQVVLNLFVKSCDTAKQVIIRTKVHTAKGIKTYSEKVVKFDTGKEFNCMYDQSTVLLSEKSLTFDVEVVVLEEYTCQETSNTQLFEPQSKLIDNFAHLLEDREFSDVRIVVKGQEFFGHKAILAVRSPVFRAMFQTKMIESKRNEVTIDDIEPKVFTELLRFIYTDSVENLDTMALELLQAADKYDFAKLKAKCEKALCGMISEKKAIEMLIAADLYRAEQLRRATIGFMQRNSKIMSSENWKNFLAEHSTLATETMLEMLTVK